MPRLEPRAARRPALQRVALVGAEFEENLSLRYLASSVLEAGFECEIHPFNQPAQTDLIVDAILKARPLVVGVSVPFQARAKEMLGLATRLRERGYLGHICLGGHFATFEYEKLLEGHPAIDSIVRHEGEATFRELCKSLRDRRTAPLLPGLIMRGTAGEICVGPKRPLPHLDEIPFPDRRGPAQSVIGIPCSPIAGSRGCYGDCSFCCIYAYADNAEGPRYRQRSPANIVREMKEEYVFRGVRLFIFHDDNFFVPHERKNLDRYRELADLLKAEQMTDVSLVIKCRPNDVKPELFQLLKSIGMIRAYVGIETNSDEGVVSLNRRITPDDNRRALRVLRDLDIYHSFNVLMFDPEATLRGIEANIEFMEEFSDVPFNFCRAEVYAGTPLKALLSKQNRLRGDCFAWNYEMRDPRVELAFRIATTAFAARNFRSDGIANQNMRIRFDSEVLRRSYPGAWDETFHKSLVDLSRDIGSDTAGHLRRILEYVRLCDPYESRSVQHFALGIARELSRADLGFTGRVRKARCEMERRIARGSRTPNSEQQDTAPVWASETERLGVSTGKRLSAKLPTAFHRTGTDT